MKLNLKPGQMYLVNGAPMIVINNPPRLVLHPQCAPSRVMNLNVGLTRLDTGLAVKRIA